MSLPNLPSQDDLPAATASPPTGSLPKLVLAAVLLTAVTTLVILAAGWLLSPSGDVESLIDALADGGRERWRAASTLAGMLQEPDNDAIRRDPEIARRLAEILRREIESGQTDPEQIRLRSYLCRALGEFHVADPMPVLILAARTEREEPEADVRRFALQAIALLCANIGPETYRDDDGLLASLEEAAGHRKAAVRGAAAFALGVIGGDRAERRLESMLTTGPIEVRFNAATGLARHGNIQCLDVLLEMLDSDRLTQPTDVAEMTILRNGLEATGQLAAANRTADLSQLPPAVKRLTGKVAPTSIRVKAAAVLDALTGR